MTYGGRLPSGQSPYPGQPLQQQQQHQHPQYTPQSDFYQQQAFQPPAQQSPYAPSPVDIPSQPQQQQHVSFNYDSFGQQHAPVQAAYQSQPQQQQWGGLYDANVFGNGATGGLNHGGVVNGSASRTGSLGDVGGAIHVPVATEQYIQSPTMWQQQMTAQPSLQQLPQSQVQRHQQHRASFQSVPSPQLSQHSVPSPLQYPAQIIPQQQPQFRPQSNNQQYQIQPQQHVQIHPSPQMPPQRRISPQQQTNRSQVVQQAQPHLSAQPTHSPSPIYSQPSPSMNEDPQTTPILKVQQQLKPSPQLQPSAPRRPSQGAPPPRKQPKKAPAEHPQLKAKPEPPIQPPPEPIAQEPEPPIQPQPQEQQFQPPPEPQFQFVNLQDIQQIPFSASSTFPTPQSLASPLTQPITHTAPTSKKHGTDSPHTTPVMQPKSHPAKSQQQSPRKSTSHSPAMSSGKVGKSPAISSRPSPYNTTFVMVSLAEEFIAKARSSALNVASSLHSDQVEDYYKMIGTGLACLDSALQSQKLQPRQEAQVRLRYATLLQEETDNVTEAETTLTKGITLCDKHRMFDLKYCMQYLMMKALFQRNPKAALKALDQHIKDCEAYQHVPWYYAFRLLKASFYLEAGSAADTPALDNIRAIQNVANTRGDAAVSVFASLSEALILLKTAKGTPEMVQECMAQAAKYQFDPTVNIHQLELMTLLVGLLSSLHREKHEDTADRLRALQKKIDEWRGSNPGAEFMLPIKRHTSSSQILGVDTSAILRPGDQGTNTDFLVMSFMTEMEFTSLVFTMGGLVRLHKPSTWGRNQSHELWREGLKLLTHWDHPRSTVGNGRILPLSQALKQRNWRIDSRCYLHTLLGLLAASQCSWDTVKQHVGGAESMLPSTTQTETIRPFLAYLNGAYCQGTGDLDTALLHYRDNALMIDSNNATPKVFQQHLAILAGMNQLWIMQHPSHENHQATTELMNELEPLCREHSNVEIQGAWSCVLASVVTHPPRQRNQRKEDAGRALKNIKGNALSTAIGLVIARDLLYNNVLGDQALSCMQAATVWAQRSGNPLWQSVVGGIMAETAEAKNEREQASKFFEKAVHDAQTAFGMGPASE